MWLRERERRAAHRLRAIFVIAGIGVLVPFFLLIWHSLERIEGEEFLRMRASAEEFCERIKEDVQRLIDEEDTRPFEDYSFARVGAWSQQLGPQLSPLAEFPHRRRIAGTIGYFQIDPDGSLSSPVLPPAPQPEGVSDTAGRKLVLDAIESFLRAPKAKPPSPQQVADLALDSSRLAGLTAAPRAEKARYSDGSQGKRTGRKQVINTIPQEELEQLFHGEAAPAQKVAPPPLSQSDTAGRSNVDRPSPKVIQFEGEIDPFQLHYNGVDAFVLFRRVWREGVRYTQGFGLKTQPFIEESFIEPFRRTPLAAWSGLVVSYRGSVLRTEGKGRVLLYRAKLPPPLEEVELLIAARQMPHSRAERIVWLLGALSAAALLLGCYAIYRVGVGQMALAREQRNFVSAVSHELKTPLTAIRMYSEMLREGWVGEESKRRSYYDFISLESERLSRLIENILRVAQLENGAVALELEEMDASELLRIAAERTRSQVESRGFTLELHDEVEGEVRVRIDEDAFAQIAINLVDNALKFSLESSLKTIVIGVRQTEQGRVAFSVRDYGPGIAETERKKIFQLFYRGADDLTRANPGTGIGLALVHDLAAKMGAAAEVADAAPGARFEVRFPVVRGARPQ